MAEIEERENGDEGRVRAWLTRALGAPRDPAWVADGQVFEHWAPVSPVSGRVGVFEWKVPATPPPAPRAMAAIEADLDRESEQRQAVVPVAARIESRVGEPPLPSAASPPSPPSPALSEPLPAPSGPIPTSPPPLPEVAESAEPPASWLSSAPPLPAKSSLEPTMPSASSPRPLPLPVSLPLPSVEVLPPSIEADAPLVPHPPDDPGPMPPEEAGERQRRFRFF
jgi:HemY protein